MKAFFEGIQWLFENIVFALHHFLKDLELSNWFVANIFNWGFMIICAAAIVYWCKQLQLHEDQGQENQDTTAHSFLK